MTAVLTALKVFTNPWVILALIAALVGGYYNGRGDGRAEERSAWELQIAEKKLVAASVLQIETGKVHALEGRVAELITQVETGHVEATNKITAAGAKYDRLGKLFSDLQARCRGGGGAASVPASGPAAVDHGGEGAGEDVPAASDGAFGELIKDADLMRVTVMACQQYIGGLPGVINGP